MREWDWRRIAGDVLLVVIVAWIVTVSYATWLVLASVRQQRVQAAAVQLIQQQQQRTPEPPDGGTTNRTTNEATK